MQNTLWNGLIKINFTDIPSKNETLLMAQRTLTNLIKTSNRTLFKIKQKSNQSCYDVYKIIQHTPAWKGTILFE